MWGRKVYLGRKVYPGRVLSGQPGRKVYPGRVRLPGSGYYPSGGKSLTNGRHQGNTFGAAPLGFVVLHVVRISLVLFHFLGGNCH